jgi:hypothetical protein
METKSASERFATVIETAKNNSSSGAKPMQSGDKDKLFSEIRKVLDVNKNRPADKQASARLIDSFIESIDKNTTEAIRSLESQDKKLMEDTLDAITKLQFKTVEEFKKSLKEINDLAAKMIARSESGGPRELGDIGKELQNKSLDERFKAEGLTLEGKDDTFVNRLKQEFFGNSKEPGREGTPTKGLIEGFKNFGSEFTTGFKKGLTPQNGVLGKVFNSQESRREEIRSEVNQSNERVSEVDRLKKMFSEAINSKTETNQSTNDNNKSVNNQSTSESSKTETNNSASDSSKTETNNSTSESSKTETNNSTSESSKTETNNSASDSSKTETNQSEKQSIAEFKSIDKMSNLTEEHKKILEQQGIKPSSEKEFSYRKDGKPVSMEEINKTLEAKYKESQQPKVKIQSAKSGIVPEDKNDISSILNEIKDIIIEIKDKLFDKKRAGVAPSGKKQLDPSSNVKEVMNRNKVAQAEAEQAAADAQKRAENIDRQNAEKLSAKVEAKEKSTPKVVIGGTESANSRVTPETPATGNGSQDDSGSQGGGGSLLGGITGAYAGFKSGGQKLLTGLKNQRYSPGLSRFADKAQGYFNKGTTVVEGAAGKVVSRANAIKSKATDFISDRVGALRSKATDVIKNRGIAAEQLVDKNGKTLSGAARQSRIGKLYRDRAAGVAEKGKGILGKASQFGKGMFGKASGVIGKEVDKGSTIGKIAKGGMNMLGKAKGAISNVAEKAMASSAGKGITKAAGKGGAKIAGKAAGKSLLKKIPLLGVGAGLAFGAGRLMKGDFLGAAGEVASGLAGGVGFLAGGAGTAASFGIDAALAARDIANENNEESTEGSTQSVDGARAAGGPVSANGSYLVGENGPEIFSPNTAGSIKTNPVTKSNLETGNNSGAANLKEMTESAKEDTAPVINVPPPTVIQQPAPPQQNNGGGSLPMDTVRTEDSSWQRFQNRRSFG